MARGIIYHITTDPYNIGDIDETDFEGHLELLSVDAVQNMADENAQEALVKLRGALAACGFKVKDYSEFDDGATNEKAAFCIDTTDNNAELENAKMRWFESQFHTLRIQLNDSSLRDFACSIELAAQLRTLIDDTYSNAVYLDHGTGPAIYTMDRFIRNMMPETVYFVSPNTVRMH